MIDWHELARRLSDQLNECVSPKPKPVSGGDISSAWQLVSASGFVFVKVDPQIKLLETQAKGLALLQNSETVAVPQVLGIGVIDGHAYLATTWLELGSNTKASEQALGQQLARLHQTDNHQFGLDHDNFIGRSVQNNVWTGDWPVFYRDYRLRPQLDLAAKNGFDGQLQLLGLELCQRVGDFFDELSTVEISLLHGDLWAGNWGTTSAGAPVIFDPAVYWGHREADLAMTELFGGFSDQFYRAYQEVWPISERYPLRRDLYNLYHLLNHLNLFGSTYYPQVMSRLNGVLGMSSHNN